MAREIKFRVIFRGNIVGYERLTDNGWQWMYLELNPDNGERWVNGVISQTEGFIRQQFTGLKDKNGKEIYEGDICLFAIEKIGVERYREIVFEEGCFIAVQYKEDGRRVLSSAFGRDGNLLDYEVIGNIHTNPELINL